MFPLLRGTEDLALVILSYINPKELHRLMINKFFAHIINSNTLWRDLYMRDFHQIKSIPRSTSRSTFPRISRVTSNLASLDADVEQGYRRLYHTAYSSFERKMIANNNDINQINNEISMHSRLKWKLHTIDAVQLRIMLPLPFVCIFLSCLLLGLKLDGYANIPYFACFIPVLFLLMYILGCFIYTAYESNQVDQDVWLSMAGPIRVLFSSRVAAHPLYSFLLFLSVILLIAQIITIVVKLSVTTAYISWGFVFIPFWILASLFCLLPPIKCIDGPMYCSGLLIWIPLVILIICLTCKFTLEETGQESFSFAELLVPFWLLELFILISSAVFVAQAIINILVAFQVLVSLKDLGASLSNMSCLIPLLVFFGAIFIWTVLFVAIYRTPYQETISAREQAHVGRIIIWKL